MEKNPLQHTHQYPLHFKWSLQRIEKNATDREIPPYPLQFKWSLTMEREIEIYTPGRRSQIMFKWSLQRTDVSSSNPLQFKPRCRTFKPTSCFFFFFWRTHFVLLSNPLQFRPRCRNFKPTSCFFFFFFFGEPTSCFDLMV